MSFKWKCINPSYLVPKNEADDNEQTNVSCIGVPSVSNFEGNTPIFKEQQGSGITDLPDCDTKNGITAGELCGYSGSNKTYDGMPSSLLLPVNAEQTETYIKQEPVEDTENNGTTNNCGVYVGMKCEVLYKETGVSGFGGQSASNFERNTSVFKAQQCSEITNLPECDTKNGITMGELCGYTGSNKSYDSIPSSQLLPVNAEQTETYIKQEPVEDTENNSTSKDCGVSVCVKHEVLYKDTGDNSAEESMSAVPEPEHSSPDSEKEYISKENRCIRCAIYFNTKSDLTEHLIDSHTNMKMLCIRSYACSGKLGKHTVGHIKKKTYSCTEWHKSFESMSVVERHLLTHTDERPYSCAECNKCFKSLSHLKGHILTHSEEKPFSCTECTKSFELLTSLNNHLLIHTNEKQHSCTECDKSFKYLCHLRKHMLIHSGKKSYSCTKCDKSFAQMSSLRRHRLTHNEKSYSCTICDKSFPNLFLLRKHKSTHSEEKPHSYTEYNKSFRYLSHLKDRLVTLSDEKPHGNTECDKSFKRLCDPRKNTLTHTAGKLHSCTECDKSFRYLSHLKAHMVTHSDEKPHGCTECDKSFKRLYALRMHALTHTVENTHSCTKCNKSFHSLHNLRKHTLTHTGSCTECDEPFSKLSHLKEHI